MFFNVLQVFVFLLSVYKCRIFDKPAVSDSFRSLAGIPFPVALMAPLPHYFIVWERSIMTNHMHLVLRSINGQKPELLLGDFKRFTSKTVVKAVMENPRESRKEWLLEMFKQAGAALTNVKDYQFWQHSSKPIELWSNKVVFEKISYIHNHPVEEGLVYNPQDYVYSSARDYAGEEGILKGVVVARKSFAIAKTTRVDSCGSGGSW